MQSYAIVLVTALLTLPLAFVANPPARQATAGLARLAQYSTGAPDQTVNGRQLQDAPVPNALPGVAPVDRVAGPGSRSLSAGPVNATPFSAAPTSGLASGSPASPNGTPGGDTTPNLGR